MARIRAGILGQVSGKVGGVVGGTWKDKNYVREYVVPANPNSAGQQTQRGLFGSCVNFAKQLVGPIFNVYTDPFQPKMSGFNYFIKRNITLFTASPTFSSVKISEGKLFPAAVTSVSADAVTDTVTVNYSTSLGSNGAADDGIYTAVYNETTGRWGFAASETTRTLGTQDVTLTMTASDVVHAYVVAAKYVSSKLNMISDSSYGTDTAS